MFKRKKNILCEQNYRAIFSAFFADPDAWLNHSAAVLIKGNAKDSTTVFRITIGEKQFVVKRYNVKNFWVLIKNLFHKSMAYKAWINSHHLLNLGINVPQPRAMVEECYGVFYGISYFITEYIVGIRGCDYFAPEMPPLSDWDRVVNEIVELAQKLYQARFIHHDFQYGNMLIVADGVYLLDLEHLKEYGAYSVRYQCAFNRDIQHFLDFVHSNAEAYALFQTAFARLSLCEV